MYSYTVTLVVVHANANNLEDHFGSDYGNSHGPCLVCDALLSVRT